VSRVKERKNKSVIYLLPMLGDNADKIIKTVSNDSNGFVNTYYHSEEDFGYTDSLKNRIYLVFDKNRIKQEIVDLLASCKN